MTRRASAGVLPATVRREGSAQGNHLHFLQQLHCRACFSRMSPVSVYVHSFSAYRDHSSHLCNEKTTYGVSFALNGEVGRLGVHSPCQQRQKYCIHIKHISGELLEMSSWRTAKPHITCFLSGLLKDSCI